MGSRSYLVRPVLTLPLAACLLPSQVNVAAEARKLLSSPFMSDKTFGFVRYMESNAGTLLRCP
jgi:hypothetical protein